MTSPETYSVSAVANPAESHTLTGLRRQRYTVLPGLLAAEQLTEGRRRLDRVLRRPGTVLWPRRPGCNQGNSSGALDIAQSLGGKYSDQPDLAQLLGYTFPESLRPSMAGGKPDRND